jgi:hypothetical protein
MLRPQEAHCRRKASRGQSLGNDSAYDVYVTGSSVGTDGKLGWATIDYAQDAGVVSPTSLTFSTNVGTTSAPQSFTITNTDPNLTLQLGDGSIGGQFTVVNSCPFGKDIAPGASLTCSGIFKPTHDRHSRRLPLL